MSQYIIGIDLGTTNCTLAYCLADQENSQIHQFAIPQLLEDGTEGENNSLPSFIYFPLSDELKGQKKCVGSFSRKRGSEIPARVIASAKSWLCYSGIDRRQSLLPLNSEDETLEQMSPLEAITEILKHLRKAWNDKMKASFDHQQVLITVPASFDPSARQFVQEAAKNAGYPEIILLEEPQAAFYSWLHAHAEEWRKKLKIGDSILVVDIGGGTTDFSLIAVQENEGNLDLQRIAVGHHLLLGGDNLDLALAYLTKQKFEEQGHVIDEWQFQSLVHTCRDAKEQLLGENPPKQFDITIMGRGSRLIGNSLKTQISESEVTHFILEGFFPIVSPQERSVVEKRGGIQQIGLPFAQDARISSQLAKFLSMTGENDNNTMENFVVPTTILFNGGTLKASALQQRLVEILNEWAVALEKEPVEVLEKPDFDFSVSRGAVYYGMARSGKALRIKSGASRSYYIGIEDAAPAVPGISIPLKAVCVVPYGMEEGTESELPQPFALVLGENAKFRFFSHATAKLSDGSITQVGSAVKNWRQELTELHPIETCLDKEEGDGKVVKVQLKSKVTELGVLELWCSAVDGRKWKLEFDIRAS